MQMFDSGIGVRTTVHQLTKYVHACKEDNDPYMFLFVIYKFEGVFHEFLRAFFLGFAIREELILILNSV